jgi:hypothetical protein
MYIIILLGLTNDSYLKLRVVVECVRGFHFAGLMRPSSYGGFVQMAYGYMDAESCRKVILFSFSFLILGNYFMRDPIFATESTSESVDTT